MRPWGLVAMCLLTASVAADVRAQEPAPADWRSGGTCYEVFVRSFQDSDGDGHGDLSGLIQRLDYINDGDPESRTDLGANCIWLMPIAASPSYHGYDVTDYYRVDPRYGTNEDFRRFVEEAHRRGIRVLVDMVINHVSSEHPYFKHSLLYSDSPYREWFRWSDEPGPNNEWGDNNWRRSPVQDEYYYGFFSHRMPDLNWESEAVREEIKRVASFWLDDMGADGLRLDAVWHLMEGPDGQAGHAPRTHDMLREFGDHVRRSHPGAITIGEVFDGSDAIFAYYPDQLDAYFAFGVSEAILEAVQTGDGSELLPAVRRMQEKVPNDRWAPFLRNHDQVRTMSVLEGDPARAKLAAALLLTLPGLPFVYYGEEIGMTGEKPDPRIRTPMHWEIGPAAGFTEGAPWEPLQPDSLMANVQTLANEPGSLLNLYRDLIHARASSPALGAGRMIALETNSPAVVAFVRRSQEQVALIVSNLGTDALANVRIEGESGAVPGGEHRLLSMVGNAEAAALEAEADGSIRGYVPLDIVGPQATYVFLLERDT
ncbi:MAG: alpha-amylase family glycosyl hydrolase [marine benthic group bacterium]|nr:alpha-amylase family glycosyl hydrolase [Gemmatimonadota bacterium]